MSRIPLCRFPRPLGRLILVAAIMLGAFASSQAQLALNVSSTPITGATITAAPADANGLTGGVTNFSLSYPIGATVTLTAPATLNGEVFANWTINGVGQAPGQTAVRVLIVNVENAVAVYNTPNVTLTVQSVNPASGVAITAAPADNGGATGGTTAFTLTYPNLTTVSLNAPATSGANTFGKWTVNGVDQPPGQTSIKLTLGGAATAVATYVTPNQTLTIQSVNPAAGVAVTAAPADNAGKTGGTTAFTLSYPNLTSVTLTAPGTAGADLFSKWTVNGVDQPIGQAAITFAISANTTAVATYITPTVTLTVQSVNPAAGIAITAAPADVNGKGGGATAFALTYPVTTVVTLTAPATSGINGFTKWTVNGVDQPVGQAAIKVTLAANSTAVATFTTPLFTVVASAVGTHGTITPSGNVPVPGGTNQTFTAAPSAGYMVKQWTLDGVVTQTGGASIQLNNVVANHTVTVSFAVILVYHPADTNKDARMVIAEVTAYGSAWKHGTAWPNSPSPIPQAYVTNAIMLWKTGELYTYDPSKVVPDAWIPLQLAPAIATPKLATQSGHGTSVCSASRQVDGTWLVNVTVTPPANCKAYTLEEHVPRGARISAVSAGGVFDAKGSILRWGPFMDSSVRIFSYRVNLGSAFTLSGSASFDGVDVKTSGDRLIGGKR
ncbi:MAG: InlB B-repeat-containing protein [Fimbriimonadaceae bacterium]